MPSRTAAGSRSDRPLIGVPYHRPMTATPNGASANPNNLLGLDYVVEANRLGTPTVPIVDVHAHLSGAEAVSLYLRVAALYGISLTYTMSPLAEVDAIRAVAGRSVRFIAVPDFMSPDRRRAHGEEFVARVAEFHAKGSRVVKLWAAPRGLDYGAEAGDPTLLALDSPARIEVMELASRLGMCIMTHIGDPDTWFATRYADRGRYGTKRSQYDTLERMLDRYHGPWIAAHFGGWPEDLGFLDGLLARHSNLHLDTSATRWIVREISRHDSGRVNEFLERWSGRILFGSDVVTSDEHLTDAAGGADAAFELYASRYWALRTLWETDHDGMSPIADPDLAMIDPHRYGPLDAPRLRGHRVPAPRLRTLYHDAAAQLLEPLHT